MNRKKLERLYREIEQIPKGSGAEETALRMTLREYLTNTGKFYQAGEDGFPPPITQIDKNALIEQYDKLAEALDRFIRKEETYDPKLVEKVNEFAELASWHFHILWRYHPEKGLKSAQTLAEENRTPRLKVTGELNTVEGNHNVRLVIGFLDDKGNEIRCIFMPERRTGTPTAHVKKGLNQLAGTVKEPGCKSFIEHILDISEKELDRLWEEEYKKWTEKYPDSDLSQIVTKDFLSKDSAAVHFLMGYACPRGLHADGSPCSADSVAEGLSRFGGGQYTAKDLRTHISETALREFALLLDKQSLLPQRKGERRSHSEGLRIDRCSVGVSIIADLLGVPEVVARAIPAILIDKAGNEFHGTLMYEARGVDILENKDALYQLGPYCLDKKNLKEVNGGGLKAALCLQVVAYLCNVDHWNAHNFCYQFREDGTWVDLQAFDSDGSFYLGKGALSIDGIPASLAQRVLNLKPERQKFVLWCCVPKAERNKAAEQMKTLKTRINNGRVSKNFHLRYEDLPCIHEIPDEEVSSIKTDDISELGTSIRSICQNVFYRREVFKPLPKKKPKDFHPTQKYCKLPVQEIIGADNRATAKGLEASQKTLFFFEQLLENKTSKIRGSSDDYRAVQSDLEQLRIYQGKLRQLSSPGMGLEKSVTPEELVTIAEWNKKVEECAWHYLYGKFGTESEPTQLKRTRIRAYLKGTTKVIFNSDYEKERIDAMLRIVKLAQKGQETAAEMKTASVNFVQIEEKHHYQRIKGH